MRSEKNSNNAAGIDVHFESDDFFQLRRLAKNPEYPDSLDVLKLKTTQKAKNKNRDMFLIEDIGRVRRTFQRTVKRKSDQPDVNQSLKKEGKQNKENIEYHLERIEGQFICKPAFILKQKSRISTTDILIYFLADVATLFSRDYQVYKTNRTFSYARRNQHGETLEKQRQCCRDFALQGLPEPLKQAGDKVLIKMEETSSTIRNEQSRVSKTKQISSAPNSEHVADGIILPRKLYRDLYLNKKPKDKTKILKKWFSHINLNEIGAQILLKKVLLRYFIKAHQIEADKKWAYNYSPTYRKMDNTAYIQYVRRSAHLKKTLERHKAWTARNFEFPFRKNSLDTNPDIGMEVPYESKATEFTESVYRATARYFYNPNSAGKNISKRYVAEVIDWLQTEKDNAAIFPFQYMMVCIAGTRRLFTTATILPVKKILEFCRNPYGKSSSGKENKSKLLKIESERVRRLRLLKELIEACNLNATERAKNWNLFLTVHGSTISSPDERELWRRILYRKKPNIDSPLEDIPPIELSFVVEEYLPQCLPIQPELLYCYDGEILANGNFIRFLKEYPNVLEACMERVKRNPQIISDSSGPKNLLEEYLKWWNSLSINYSEVRKSFEEAIKSFRWGTIPNASNGELTKHLQSARKMTGEALERNIRQFKSLLVECAVRRILAERAAEILLERAKVLFNQGTAFQALSGRTGVW